MTIEPTFSSVLLPFPKWRRLISETAHLDMPSVRRLVLLRIIDRWVAKLGCQDAWEEIIESLPHA